MGWEFAASASCALSWIVSAMSSREPVQARVFCSCPKCRAGVHYEQIKPRAALQCPNCGSSLRIRPTWTDLLSSLGVSLLISQFLGLKAYAAVVWILLFVFCLILSPASPLVEVSADSHPPAQTALRRNLNIFLAIWFACTAGVFAEGFVFGWISFLLGASHRDILELCHLFSFPLGWFSTTFDIRPEKSLVLVLGIVASNSFLYTVPLFGAFKIVHRMLRRGHVIELAIRGRAISDDER